MKNETRTAVSECLRLALQQFRETPFYARSERQTWQRRLEGGWEGRTEVQEIPALPPGGEYGDAIRIFDRALKRDYPEHFRLIGTPFQAGAMEASQVLSHLITVLYKRSAPNEPSEEDVDGITADLASFFNSDTVNLQVLAPVINLRGRADFPWVRFPNGFVLRPTTNEEATLHFGQPGFVRRRTMFGPPDFVLVKDIRVPKVVGDVPTDRETNLYQSLIDGLNTCILSLVSFKDGVAGWEGFFLTPKDLALGPAFWAPSYSFTGASVPFGIYELGTEEAREFAALAVQFADMHASLEAACERLVDATHRTKPRDAIIDCVIGLEGILLYLPHDRYQGELRFRFSLNYASLFAPEQREAAFDEAQEIYDLRSSYAHGGAPRRLPTRNGQELSLQETAHLARTLLRNTIKHFVDRADAPAFLAGHYWRKRVLAL
jgi:hypothetical protein